MAMAGVRSLFDFCRVQFSMKAGPATTRVVLALRAEQGVIATDAVIGAVPGMIAVFSTERCFGAGLTGYTVLLGIQLGLPLLFTFCDFIHGFLCAFDVIIRASIDTQVLKKHPHCSVSFTDWCDDMMGQ